jgi:hypothetical protein
MNTADCMHVTHVNVGQTVCRNVAVCFASKCFEAITLVHVSKLKSRFVTLGNKNKACHMFFAIEIKDNRKYYVPQRKSTTTRGIVHIHQINIKILILS